MHSVTFWSVMLVACVAATPVVAGDLRINQHDQQGSLTWRDAGHVFGLHADAASGLVVTQADAKGTWGLQQGDVVLAVDGHPVRQIEGLVDRLRASKHAAVTVRVRRGHAPQELTLAAEEYGHLISPKPPVPPAPPAGPIAPPPPLPPPPPAGG